MGPASGCFCSCRPAWPWPRETPDEKFQRQHVDPAGSWDPDPTCYCNLMMPRRNLTAASCKELNSFIHRAPAGIAAVCSAAGTWRHGNFHYSNAPVPVTDCQATGASHWPRCQYRGGFSRKRVFLACNKGRPVHHARPAVCTSP